MFQPEHMIQNRPVASGYLDRSSDLPDSMMSPALLQVSILENLSTFPLPLASRQSGGFSGCAHYTHDSVPCSLSLFFAFSLLPPLLLEKQNPDVFLCFGSVIF
ncbi:hypothetical protein GDO81_022323 [Engystomops pustulosus]|uniref:Uncharacterized protein n=1 Tax=Engystomops pustulosus TaxID=76066 RepID=A0AAV6YU10_ENGPU|nr:hypothetical protein GDO81_022323 [Engystomops pustulosus]